MNATFFGHRDIAPQDQVTQWPQAVISQLIDLGATAFYLGGYGDFDRIAKAVLLEEKTHHPDIELILVKPYIKDNLYTAGYDSTTYPPLESVPPNMPF